MPHLSLSVAKKLAAAVKIETEFAYNQKDNDEWVFEQAFGKIFLKQVRCPALLSEWILVFQKLGEVKGLEEWICTECHTSIDLCVLPDKHRSEKNSWLYHYLQFCELAATDWAEAEKYLEGLL